MKIDIHAHNSNHKLWGLHTESATISDLEKEAKKHAIKKIFLMATYFPYKKSGLKNEVLLDRIKGNNLFGMFASLDAGSDVSAAVVVLRKFAQGKLIAGLKLYPGYQKFSLSDKKINPVYELAEEFDLPIAIHVGELHHCCPKEKREKRKTRCGDICPIDTFAYLARPREAESAIRNHPNVNFVLAHLGNPYFNEVRDLMKKYPNVYTDMSGQFISASHEDTPEYREELKIEMLKFFQIENAIDRFMFASDFPIQSYKDSIELVEALGLSKEEKEKIYSKNAIKLFNLREDVK